MKNTLAILLVTACPALSQITSTFMLRGEYDMHTNAPTITVQYPGGPTVNLGTNWMTRRAVTNGEIWSVAYPPTDIQTNSTFGSQPPVILNGTYTTISAGVTNSVELWIQMPVGYCGADYVFYLDPSVENSLAYHCFHRTAATELSQPLSRLSVWGITGTNYFYGANDIAIQSVADMAVGIDFGLLLLTNHSVSVFPLSDDADTFGQMQLPASLSNNVIQVACGNQHAVALLDSGRVVMWGSMNTAPSSASNILAVACGSQHCLAIKTNGTVIAWGSNLYGESTVPGSLADVVQVAGGSYFSAALKSNGTVVAWGDNTYGATSVPSGLSNVVRITCGTRHMTALKSDRTVAAWGGGASSPSLTNVIYTASGEMGDWFVTGDGAVTMVGNDNGIAMPALTNIVLLSTRGQSHAVISGPVLLNVLSRGGTNANVVWPAAVGGSIYTASSIGSSWSAATNTVKYEREVKHIHIAGGTNQFFRLTTNTTAVALGLGADLLTAPSGLGGTRGTNLPPYPGSMAAQFSEEVQAADPIEQFYELVLWIEAMRRSR